MRGRITQSPRHPSTPWAPVFTTSGLAPNSALGTLRASHFNLFDMISQYHYLYNPVNPRSSIFVTISRHESGYTPSTA